MHSEIDELRKLRDGGTTSADDVETVMQKWISTCPSDAYIIIDQPGLRVEDFQELPSIDKVPVWDQWRTFLGRSATLGSFPRLDRPLDSKWLEGVIKKQCRAMIVTANVKDTDPKDKSLPIEEYHDVRKRIIRAKFPRLPETQPERIIALQKHDQKLLEILQRTPTPFFSLIYTSSTGERFNPDETKFKQARFWDIFGDIVRQKRDPRNRRDWISHQSRRAKSMATEAVERRPPMAEVQRQRLKDKLRENGQTGSEKDRMPSYLEKYLTDDMLVKVIGVNIACLGIYGAFKVLTQWL